MRRGMIALATALLLAGSLAASEVRPPEPLPTRTSLGSQAGDLLLRRPVAIVRLVAGIAVLPVALPVSVLLWDPGWALEVCVTDPARDLVAPLASP